MQKGEVMRLTVVTNEGEGTAIDSADCRHQTMAQSVPIRCHPTIADHLRRWGPDTIPATVRPGNRPSAGKS
jgi:hypothetical protein